MPPGRKRNNVIRFLINKDTIKKDLSTEEWEALERAQDGEARIYHLRPLLARFVVDDKGKPVLRAQALRQLGAMPLEEFLTDVVAAFTNAMKETAVPNASGRPSNSDSEAISTPPSPTGAELYPLHASGVSRRGRWTGYP